MAIDAFNEQNNIIQVD